MYSFHCSPWCFARHEHKSRISCYTKLPKVVKGICYLRFLKQSCSYFSFCYRKYVPCLSFYIFHILFCLYYVVVFSIVALFSWSVWVFLLKVSEESKHDEEEDGLTEEEFKKTEIYSLLIGDVERKFGASVNWSLVEMCYRTCSWKIFLLK